MGELTVSLSPAQVEAIARRMVEQADPDRWRDKQALAGYFGCGVRTIETWIAEGAPCRVVAGRVKGKAAEVEAWAIDHGHIRGRLDNRGTVVTGSSNGAATAATAPPHDREVCPDGNQG
jgi:hypothetical protein